MGGLSTVFAVIFAILFVIFLLLTITYKLQIDGLNKKLKECEKKLPAKQGCTTGLNC